MPFQASHYTNPSNHVSNLPGTEKDHTGLDKALIQQRMEILTIA
jgi:hypothetical protein